MKGYPEKMMAAAERYRAACHAVADEKAPLEAGGWNLHQLTSHTRDVEIYVYGARMRRTVEEDNPEFQDFDAEEWMAENYDVNEPFAELLEKFMVSVQKAVDWLHALPPEAWDRESRHEMAKGSVFTLRNWVERDIAHIEEHLETINKNM